MNLLVDVLVDSVVDTLKLVPFLFVTYLAMEALEHTAGDRAQRAVEASGKAGPLVGALLGALPQCGFSAMAATLYSGGVITVGALVAVILSTSDEMIPVFVAHQEPLGRLLAIMAVKVVVGIAVGFVVDVALHGLHRVGRLEPHIHDLCERANCGCEDEKEDHGHGDHDHAGHAHGGRWWHIVRSALVHTVQVTFFIFVVSLAFGLIIELVGQDALGAILANHPVRATFLAALIGLIPNCGASVAITELYLEGILAAGPMIAGLLSSGGVGLLVLWRTNDNMKQNATVTVFVYVVGVLVGLLVSALGILF